MVFLTFQLINQKFFLIDNIKDIIKKYIYTQKRISILEKIKVYESIRDIKFVDNKLYLFLENTASIGIIYF